MHTQHHFWDIIFSRRWFPDTFPPQAPESQCQVPAFLGSDGALPSLTDSDHRTIFNTHQEMNKRDGKPQADPCLSALHFAVFQTQWYTEGHWKTTPSGSWTWWIKYSLALTRATEEIKILSKTKSGGQKVTFSENSPFLPYLAKLNKENLFFPPHPSSEKIDS